MTNSKSTSKKVNFFTGRLTKEKEYFQRDKLEKCSRVFQIYEYRLKLILKIMV